MGWWVGVHGDDHVCLLPNTILCLCAFADKLIIMGLHRPDVSARPKSCYFMAFDRSSIFRPLGQTNGEPPQPVFAIGHPPLNSHY